MNTLIPATISNPLRALLAQHEDNPHALVQELAEIVNATLERNLLTLQGAGFTPVLSASELAHLERILPNTWLSGKNVWLALRAGEPYEHGMSIALGRQLSARYTRQRKQGATRMFWIEPQAIVAPAA